LPAITQIHVEDLKARRDAGEELFILDVREPAEYALSNLGGVLIPVDKLPQRLGELDKHREIIVHCKGGVRSTTACELLIANGFTNVKNLAGGIVAWAKKIDPTMPV
jgi:adenylyltransferase/sulfurtransferase